MSNELAIILLFALWCRGGGSLLNGLKDEDEIKAFSRGLMISNLCVSKEGK